MIKNELFIVAKRLADVGLTKEANLLKSLLRKVSAEQNDLSSIFSAAKKSVEDRLATDLIVEWVPKIENDFALKFPMWQIKVKMERTIDYIGPGYKEDYFQISIALSPSDLHPDKDWMYTIDINDAKQFDSWFGVTYSIDSQIIENAYDMERRADLSFPAYSTSSIQIRW